MRQFDESYNGCLSKAVEEHRGANPLSRSVGFWAAVMRVFLVPSPPLLHSFLYIFPLLSDTPMASRNTHVQLNSQIPLPSSPPHPRTPHLCLLDPSISNPKVTANSTHHQPNSWALSQDILRRVGATCLSSHSKQVAGARCKPSTAQVHPCPVTLQSVGQATWEGRLDVFPLWCPLLPCSIWESSASF